MTHYSCSARPMTKLLAEKKADSAEKAFFETVLAVKAYAGSRLGLAANRNYTEYLKINKDYLVDVVAACRPDTFCQFRWWFPFFGSFPYKGYFKRDDALAEARRLKKKGWDVTVGCVDGFSTLGFFRDPAYSFMVTRPLFSVVSLIIHEQVHATVYLKNQTEFNEEAATFIGDEGAMRFIAERYGGTSDAYQMALRQRHDEEVWQIKLGELYRSLAGIYSGNIQREEKLRLKSAAIDSFKTVLTRDYASLFKTDHYKGVAAADINNAYLTVRMNYYKGLPLFYELYKKNGGDLPAIVAVLKHIKRNKIKDPLQYLAELVKQ